MRASVFICLAAITCAAPAQPDTAQQNTAQQDTAQQDTALEPVVELPPRYRIEFILFAHNRFNENEEYFDVVPSGSIFAKSDEPVAMRFFDEDSQAELRASIEGPISAPPRDESEPDESSADALLEGSLDPDLMLEAYLDPRLVEGPNTRYLEPEELTLAAALENLELVDAYMPLLHSGWEQNGLPETDAVALDLTEFGSLNPRGTLRLHMSRYLHMSVDLAFVNNPLLQAYESPPAVFSDAEVPPRGTPSPSGFPAGQFGGQFGDPFGEQFGESTMAEQPRYFLFEERRILRGELNYFDHPAFGLLLQITLAPEPQSEPESDIDGPSA